MLDEVKGNVKRGVYLQKKNRTKKEASVFCLESVAMNTPSQDACNRNNGRGPPQQYRPFHPYKNRRNNNFKQNNNFRNNRFNGPGDGTNEMNPNNFSPQGFSSPIVRNAGGGGGEHFNNYRNNRNGGNGNYRNDGYKNRKNFTPFKVGSLANRDFNLVLIVFHIL